MSIVGSNPHLLQSTQVSDPSLGPSFQQVWIGDKASLLTVQASAIALGGKCQLTFDNGLQHRLTILYTFDPSSGSPGGEPPTIHFTDSWSPVDISIFAHPKAVAEAGLYITPAQYKVDLEEAVSGGDANPLSTVSFPFSQRIYNNLARGVDTFQIRRPVLKRMRVYNNQFVARRRVDALETVYSTAALVSTFAIPTLIESRLPLTPGVDDTPLDTLWGWRITGEDSQIDIFKNRTEEYIEWTFAAWPVDFYNFVS